MFKVWTFAARDREALAQALEHHLNEYAQEVISVSYAVTDMHSVLAVYREIEMEFSETAELAVDVAEQILEDAQA